MTCPSVPLSVCLCLSVPSSSLEVVCYLHTYKPTVVSSLCPYVLPCSPQIKRHKNKDKTVPLLETTAEKLKTSLFRELDSGLCKELEQKGARKERNAKKGFSRWGSTGDAVSFLYVGDWANVCPETLYNMA